MHSHHPFPADRPHRRRLRSELSGFLFAIVWRTEWSLLLHDVIGDWMFRFAANAASTAASKIVSAFEWPGQPPPPKNCPFPLGFRHPTGGGPSHGHSNMQENLVKMARVVPEMCSRTNRQTNRQTHTQTCSSQYFATAPAGEVKKVRGHYGSVDCWT